MINDITDVGYGSRETRQWWVMHGDTPKQVTGYICPNLGMWWCPEIGYSCSEGIHLFTTEAKAIDDKISQLERLVKETDERLKAVRLHRSTIKDI